MPTLSARNRRRGPALVAMLSIALWGCGEAAPPMGPDVEVVVTSVSVSASSDEIEAGATLQVSATVSPTNASQEVTWSTSDEATALVSASGLVTAVSPGDVTITATSTADAAHSGSVDITVTCRNIVQAMVDDGGTLPGDACYQVLTALSVNDGTLVVEPGAHISFGPNGSLSIAAAGRLSAVGIADNPVVFTSLDPAQRWRGIRLAGSASLDNRLENVVLENGGSAGWSGAAYSQAALLLEGDTWLDVAASEIRGSGGQGLTAGGDVVLTVQATTFSENAVAAWVHPNAARAFGSDNVFSDNDQQAVRVAFGNNDAVSETQSWQDIGVPFEIQTRMFVEAPLTLDPGVELSFEADVSMIVREDGTLTAVGTADAPVWFSGSEDVRGYWKGVQITTVSSANVFDNVVFENGGSSAWTGDPDSRAMVYLTTNSKAVFTGSTFRASDHYAVWVPAGGDISGFSQNVIENNGRTMVVHPDRVGGIDGDNAFFDNDEAVVRVSFGNNDTVESTQTWARLEVPYLVTVRTFVEAPLAIEPGAQLLFAQDASLVVTDDGSLNAVGTADDPIVFSGREELAAYWKGIQFGTASAGNVLEHVTLEHAGSQPWFGGDDSVATLFVTGTGLLDLVDVTIRATEGYALILDIGGAVTCTNVDDGGFMYYDRASSSSSAICP